ncbi:MAG TPA: hypothetical protein VFZ53_28595 [Polyangiaceae bacterium]
MPDPEIARSDGDFVFETCGHSLPPRRVCDVCKTSSRGFVACSNRCLRAHQEVAHDPALPADTATRMRRALADRHRESADLSELYARHRERVMALIPAEPAGGTLCVFGAGKCDDLDLPRLAHRFAKIHLVDLDGEAIERARDRQPSAVRDAIVLHGGVDLSGLLARLDEWGDAFPDDDALHEAVFGAPAAVVDPLGGPFDVTVSTCVLSQLVLPFQKAWAASDTTWEKLGAATMAVHVGSLARSTAQHGAVSLVFDVLSCDVASELAAFRERPSEELETCVEAQARSGAVVLEPDPFTLLALIGNSGLAAPPGPQPTGPWLWDIGPTLQLVYAIGFRRA